MQESTKPLAEHLKDFLEYIEIERGLAKSTQISYRRGMERLKGWLNSENKGQIKPHELTAEDLWQYRLYLVRSTDRFGKPLSKGTQNFYLIILRQMLAYLSFRDIVALPSRKVTLAKITDQQKTIKFLTTEQIRKLMEAPDTNNPLGIRDRTIFEVLFSTGLRIAELVALNKEQFSNIWNQEDFELGIIGKGSYPRMVFFSVSSTYWIKKYLKSRNDTHEALFVNYGSRTERENRLTKRSIERLMKRHVLKAGIPIFASPHTLRHSMATSLMEQGVDLRSIQEFLGHKNIMTTQIYTHVTNKRLHDIHRQFHSGNNL